MTPSNAVNVILADDLIWRKRGEAAVNSRQALLELVERQQATEMRLQQSLATLRLRDSALGAISQGVLISDAAGRVTYMNRACEEITGYTEAEMMGRRSSLLQGLVHQPENIGT